MEDAASIAKARRILQKPLACSAPCLQPSMPELRELIRSALAAMTSAPLGSAANALLGTLGYRGDRSFVPDPGNFDQAKARFPEWKSADILFQLTDEELPGHGGVEASVQVGLLRSYLFCAIDLRGEDHARGTLTGIARQIGRIFPMPVVVLIRHGDAAGAPVLSIAVINCRRDMDRDALEKVALISGISLPSPHAGHLDILESLAFANQKPIRDFDALHAAWEEIFNVELLHKRFYRELANWYFRALPQVGFPADIGKDDEKRRATGLIRLLTRLIFCWFLKEKGLVPETLFKPSELGRILKGFDPGSESSSVYYQGILQNLFFATQKKHLYRHEKLFAVPQEEVQALFAGIPFLNGGLFGCPDQGEEDTEKRAQVPDRLFFDNGDSGANGDKKRKAEKVTGLISILERYKFTIVENTPIDQEIALDPELLGRVFENLLASYNEETRATARKQTGSFYTPRPIVDYMVDESLKAYLCGALTKDGMSADDARAGLDILFAYTEREHPFRGREAAILLEAIHACKILDPACGSAAFPMGVLQKLVHVLRKLDPGNAANESDYARKLYIIENCLYGVDIQTVAIELSKLRFFISLICEQRTDIRPLPNLETKFVAANALLRPPLPGSALAEGFDIVIGNPPYYKENDDKRRFDGLRELPCYQGKMDVWYLFTELGLDLLKPGGVLSYIATNNWVTNAGASKMRAKVMAESMLVQLIDFQGFMIFESASVQTMVMLLVKQREPRRYRAGIARASSGFSRQDIDRLSSGSAMQEANLEAYPVEIDRELFAGKPLLFNSGDKELILAAIQERGTFHLERSEIAQGIVPNPDRVNSRNIKTLGAHAARERGVSVGDGVFVLDAGQAKVIQGADREFLKPLYEPVHLGKYHCEPTDLSILYTKKGLIRPDEAPSIIKHLSRFREIMEERRENRTGQIAYYNLHWPRDEAFFREGGRILVPRKCAVPGFYYTGDPAYVMLSVNVIRTSRLDMKYLSAVLNSSVVYYWLRFRGSMQGLNFQMDAAPIQGIPIVVADAEVQRRVAVLVDLVQEAHRVGETAAARFIEELIDACIMECYFPGHMAERGLRFLDELAVPLAGYSESKKRGFIAKLHDTLSKPGSRIRERMGRISVESPELLGVIRAEAGTWSGEA